MKNKLANGEGTKILLTGGSGFLGSAIVAEMLHDTCPVAIKELVIFDLLEPAPVTDDRVGFIRGDVRNLEELTSACDGVDLVIHMAAIVDWGSRSEKEILEVNYGGTRNAVLACRRNGIGAMLYTSSLDVLFDGQELKDVDENTPYPETHSNNYCESKYLSEKYVLDANDGQLRTCVLRPSDIYGENDPFHIGSLISMAKGGFYVRLGDGSARSQHVYVGNMAHAVILAAAALLNGNDSVRGKAYFITDGPGSNFFTFFDRIVEASGYRIWPGNLWLSRGFAFFLGSVSEFFALLLRPVKKYTPKMSRFAVTYTCTTYTFNSDRAHGDFGFVPKYGPDEAIERTAAYYRVNGRV